MESGTLRYSFSADSSASNASVSASAFSDLVAMAHRCSTGLAPAEVVLFALLFIGGCENGRDAGGIGCQVV